MRVCVIAPATAELDTPAEVQAVANVFSAARWVVRITEGSRRGLREALFAGRFDLVWFAGHGGPDGFALIDGVWKPAEVGRWLSAVQAWGLIANACFSAEHVMAIQRVADVDVVATIAPDGVADDEAAEAALFLATALVETGDLAQATRAASANGALQYRFFPGGGDSMAVRSADEQAQHDDLAALVGVFKGDPRTGQPGLVATLNALSLRVEAMTAVIEQYQASTNARLDALERAQRLGGQVSMSPRVASLMLGSSLLLIILMFWILVRLGGA